MSGVGEAINKARLQVSKKAAKIQPRTCTVSVPDGATRDSYGEEVEGAPTEVTDVPGSFEALKAYERVGSAGVNATADFKLELPFFVDGEYLNIPANATVTFDADDYNPERVFRVTGPLESTSSLWQQVAAVLVQ